MQSGKPVLAYQSILSKMFYGQSQEGVGLDCISHCILLVGFLSLGVLFSLHALLILYFHFSHLVSFNLRTVPNFTVNSAACNRLHAFACSVRVGCLISACNVRVILALNLIFLSTFVRYCCCLYMLDCGKYFPPRASLFPGLNFISSFFASPR